MSLHRCSFGLLPLAMCMVVALDLQAEPVQIITKGFDCAPKNVSVNPVGNPSDNHFELRFPNGGRGAKGWFMFRVVNAQSKTVTIELKNIPSKWMTLNPVVAEVDSAGLSNLKNFTSVLPKRPAAPQKAANGPLIPDDSGETWRFIRNVSTAKGTLILKHRFATSHAWIAMRPPFTPDYMDTLSFDLEGHRDVTVHTLYPTYTLSLDEVGNSKLQEKFSRRTPARRHYVIQIGKASQRKPCVLIYAREHADEHDGSWVAEGAIRFLLSNHAKARVARARAVFLIIPLLDPEGAVHSIYSRITHNFAGADVKTPETLAYAEFFHDWVNAGNRLDLCFNLHNVESKETTHLTSAYMEPKKSEKYPLGRYEQCVALHKTISSTMKEGNILVAGGTWGKRYGVARLGGFVRDYYGTLHMPYEVNSQAPRRHLTLSELRSIGAYLAIASVEYLHSAEAKSLVDGISSLRTRRKASFSRYKQFLSRKGVFGKEIWSQAYPDFERVWYEQRAYSQRYRVLQPTAASFLRKYFRQ